MQNQAPAELLTKSQLAKRIKVCNRQIEIMSNQNIIPCIRFGRCVRYHWNDVLKALESHQKALKSVVGRAKAKTSPNREQDQV